MNGLMIYAATSIAAMALVIYGSRNKKAKTIVVNPDDVREIAEDADGHLMVTRYNGRVNVYTQVTKH